MFSAFNAINYFTAVVWKKCNVYFTDLNQHFQTEYHSKRLNVDNRFIHETYQHYFDSLKYVVLIYQLRLTMLLNVDKIN